MYFAFIILCMYPELPNGPLFIFRPNRSYFFIIAHSIREQVSLSCRDSHIQNRLVYIMLHDLYKYDKIKATYYRICFVQF